MTRTEAIEELSNILEELKENSIGDIAEHAYEKAIYCIEDAIEQLTENED